VHGTDVVVVQQPGEHAGADADAAVTSVPGLKLAVRTADCVPIILEGSGAIAVVHAGWRGLAGGIIGRAIDVMGGARRAVVGPHIRVGCYEFGAEQLDEVAAVLGEVVRGRTTWDTPALDLSAAVRTALGGIAVEDAGGCTACTDLWFSWRARQDTARFATIAWLA
jgi:copper oxidase (laccase) domain-containing protein